MSSWFGIGDGQDDLTTDAYQQWASWASRVGLTVRSTTPYATGDPGHVTVPSSSANPVERGPQSENETTTNPFEEIESLMKEENIKDIFDAARNGYLTVVKYLVENKNVNANSRDGNGKTPLHRAALNGHLNVIKYLIDGKHIKVDAVDMSGHTSLHESSYFGYLDIVKYLVGKGANVNARSNDGETPLHKASWSGKINVAQYLVENGADLNAKDKNNNTPLNFAEMSGQSNVAQYLREMAAGRNRRSIESKDLSQEEEPSSGFNRNKRQIRYRRHKENGDLEKEFSESSKSSSARPSSWIADFFSWVKRSIGELLSSKPESTAISVSHVDEQFAKASVCNRRSISTMLSSDGEHKKEENGGVFRDFDYINANLKQVREIRMPVKLKHNGGKTMLGMGDRSLSHADCNDTMIFPDTLIRKLETGDKHVSMQGKDISEEEALSYALGITEHCKKIMEQVALKNGISMHRLGIDFVWMQRDIAGKVARNKFDKIAEIVSSYAEAACPGGQAGFPGKLSSKKFDKFVVDFNTKLNVELGQLMQQMLLQSGNIPLRVRGEQIKSEPQSYLSNIFIEGHLAQAATLMLS